LSLYLFGLIFTSSPSAVRQRDNLAGEVAPGSSRRPAALALSLGNLLYLASVALIASATVTVFFGTGYLLLVSPTAGTRAGSGAQNPRPEVQSPVRRLWPSEADRETAAARRGRAAVGASLPGSGDATPVSAIPLPPQITAETPEPQEHKAGQSYAGSPTVAVPPSIAENSALFDRETQTEAKAAKASHGVAGLAAAADQAPGAFAASALNPPGTPFSAAEIAGLLEHGDTLLRTGDVASARLFYERAAAAGDGRAALRLGATFDPAFLDRAGLRNVQGSAAEARSWYGRALDLETAEAKRQPNRLESKQER
jgi:hypothetical protein